MLHKWTKKKVSPLVLVFFLSADKTILIGGLEDFSIDWE
jgi:hypothetical protein